MTRGRNDDSPPGEPKPLSAHESGKFASRTQEAEEPTLAAPATGGSADYLAEAGLTGRQRQILELMAKGLTNEQISKAIYREISTVDKHVENLFKKLKVHSRADAIIVFLQREIRDLLRDRARCVRQRRRAVLQKEALRKENKALLKENAALKERLARIEP